MVESYNKNKPDWLKNKKKDQEKDQKKEEK